MWGGDHSVTNSGRKRISQEGREYWDTGQSGAKKTVWHRMSDYGKFDIRLDSSGRYFFLDCNSNPALDPKDTAIANILDIYCISFLGILKRLLLNTMRDAAGKRLLPVTGGR